MYLLLLYLNVEDYSGHGQGCHHLPATSTNRGVESHSNVVINLGTTPTLTSTTLALRKDTLVYPGALVLERPIKEDEIKP